MKKQITFLSVLLMFACMQAFGQAPQAFKYQTIARDNSGNIIANTNVSFRMSILQGSTSGPVSYEETDMATTNQFGLANLSIGMGTVVSGNMTSINWGSNTYYIKVEFDPTGGNSFTLMGTSQMLSVPYALYAANGGTPYSAGTGISVNSNTITNTAPNQAVTLTGTGTTTVTGTYPNFTVGSSAYSAGTGISINSNTITNTEPNQAVTVIGIGATTVTGTYPNFTVKSSDTAQYSKSTGDTTTWLKSGSNIYYTKGSVGVGTNSFNWGYDTAKLQVMGTLLVEDTSNLPLGIQRKLRIFTRGNGIGDASPAISFEMGVYPGHLGGGYIASEYNIPTSGVAKDLVFAVPTGNVNPGTETERMRLLGNTGSLYIKTPGQGVVLSSPNGNCWQITVSNTGVISATSITCP